MTRKRVHRGRTQFRIKSDPEFGQLSPDLTNDEVSLTLAARVIIPRQGDRFR